MVYHYFRVYYIKTEYNSIEISNYTDVVREWNLSQKKKTHKTQVQIFDLSNANFIEIISTPHSDSSNYLFPFCFIYYHIYRSI